MHRGPAARFAAATATFAALALVASVAASAALADTIGGEQLASTHRTVSLLPGGQALPDVWAETWIIADAKTGEVLAQKGSHVQRPPASTLKMLTALTVLPRTSPDGTYVATER
ncbi:MAG: D-alanyl-D-alanine carboxypeptidase, partial [bacterium]|nr:D-alanyl-D-alanine carboxypeptidase [bacterium]